MYILKKGAIKNQRANNITQNHGKKAKKRAIVIKKINMKLY